MSFRHGGNILGIVELIVNVVFIALSICGVGISTMSENINYLILLGSLGIFYVFAFDFLKQKTKQKTI